SQLVTILKRNLRPFLRKELFYLEINSLGNLRNLVTRREAFSDEVSNTFNIKNNRKVNEISIGEQSVNEYLKEEVCEIQGEKVENENKLLCWNCRRYGHKYFDCQAEKKIFYIRPFVEVKIFNKVYGGLLDSGATVSCLSGQAAREYLNENMDFKFTNSEVETAGGQKYKILGTIKTEKRISKRNTRRMRNYYRNVKLRKKLVVATIIHNNDDMRSYAKVKLLEFEEHGLLDTGANISCIGSTLAKENFSQYPEFKNIKSYVKTADGKAHDVVGMLNVKMAYKDME
ncbi:hypothetical protein KR059_004939, partial [Drosophila kikkawai]